MNFGESLTTQSFQYPDKIAVKDDVKAISFRQLNAKVNSIAHALVHLGIKKGDVICQLQGNNIEHIELLYALAKTGMIRLPLNVRANKSEFAHIINNFKPAALVFDDTFASTVREIRPQLNCSHYICAGAGTKENALSFEELTTTFPDTELNLDINEDDPFLVQSTSGTTGIPKAALLTQRGIINRCLIRAVDLGNTHNGIYLALTSLSNTGTLFYTLSQLYIGGQVILRNRFDATDVLETITREKVTCVNMVPIMWDRVIEVQKLRHFKLSSLQIVISFAAPLHTETKNGILELISPNLYETYGSTESGPIATLMPRDQLKKKESVGKAGLHAKIKIMDCNGNELPTGGVGEIVVQTPSLFVGYLNNHKATEEVLKNGWYYTGDVGRFDDDNYLYIVGRSRDMIISGGYNVYPEEVERLIERHPAVQEVAVIGIPSEKWGESIKAVVVLKSGEKASETEIINFCKDHLSSYKKPQSVDFVNSLPHTGASKVVKEKLREKYWSGSNRQVH